MTSCFEHFDNIMDFNFTAEVEEKFDVAQGQMDWRTMLKDFYHGFKERGQHPRKCERLG